MSNWKFLTNYALVLVHLTEHPTITARELALSIGITERAIRKIIADLETEGYLDKTKEGRRLRFKVNSKLPFRHSTQNDKAIEKLLAALNGEQTQRKPFITDQRPSVQPLGSET